MKKLILILLVFLSIEVVAQTKSVVNKDTITKTKSNKTVAATAAVEKAKPIDEYKKVNIQYKDSVQKYRELAMYYQSTPRGPKDTAVKHCQKMAIAFQRKHVLLNRSALMYNDSLIRKKRKEDLEKKYKVTLK